MDVLEFLSGVWPVIIILILLLFLISFRRKFNRHGLNKKKAMKVLNKINTFTGQDRGARIFSYLRKIDPFVFEELLLHCYELKGYKVIRNKRYTGDGGIDGRVIDSSGKHYLIQAKRYKSYIKLSDVSDFSLIVHSDPRADAGIFIHTGKTGKGTKQEFSDQAEIYLVSGERLLQLIDKRTR